MSGIHDDIVRMIVDELSYASTVAEFSEALQRAEEQPADVRKRIAAGLEDRLNRDLFMLHSDISPDEVAEHLARFKEEFPFYLETGGFRAQESILPESIRFIIDNADGEETDCIKLFAKEAGKLSDAEYSTPGSLMKIMMYVVAQAHGLDVEMPEPLQPTPQKTNPFRQTPQETTTEKPDDTQLENLKKQHPKRVILKPRQGS